MDEAETAAAIARHAWFEGWEPVCFTLIEGIDEDEAIRRFGGDPAAAQIRDPGYYWELMDSRHYYELLQVLQIGTADTGHVFAVEVNGWTGSSVHASLSRGGARAFTVYTHVNAADRTVYSVDGRHVIDEEPWGPLTPLSDPEPDPAWDPAWCEGLSDEENDVWLRGARQLVLAERVMGVRIEKDWFTMPLRTVVLPDPERNPMAS